MDKAVLDIGAFQNIRREDPLDRSFSPGQRTPFHDRWFEFADLVPSSLLRLLLGAGLVLSLIAPGWAFPFINKDGQRVDIVSQLPKDKDTVVFFHAPWSKTSSRYQVELAGWEKKQSKIAILGIQVKSLDSPVSKQYGVTEVPAFFIYDEKGELTHKGQAALSEVLKMMKEPVKP